MAARQERRSYWTWGYESDEPSGAVREEQARIVSARFGREVTPPPVVPVEEAELRPSRIEIPARMSWVTGDHVERATHTYGGHALELLAGLRGTFVNPPDAVAHPLNEDELEATLQWCDQKGFSAVPYGGGTSVVWGVNAPHGSEAAVTIDLDHLSSVIELDEISRAVRVEAGILGPDLEAHLKPFGLTLRHFPQSFRWSTVGGWIATRAGGHYATNHTHIDDFVEATRMLTPGGWMESRRLPGSGAGPSPDRLVIGSEGILGVISSAWLRLQKRPVYRATAGIVFPSWEAGTTAARHIVQLKLWPANLRILDPVEAANNAGLDGRQSILIVGFESAELSQRDNMRDVVAVAREFGGAVDDDAILIDDGTGTPTGRDGAVGAWRNAFVGVNGGAMVGLGLLWDTFETAITWDRWPAFDAAVRERVGSVMKETMGDGTMLSCRFTHIYPDGPAPYYSFSGPVTVGGEAEVWRAIKDEATAAVVEAGGTVTHHHAVGRMHAAGWAQQRPGLFGEALRATKNVLDPNGIMNPGVLLGGESQP